MYSIVIIISGFLAFVFYAVCFWFIFRKAGKPRWKSIVPIYNAYILCHVAGWSGWELILTMFIWVIRTTICMSLKTVAYPNGSILAFVLLIFASIPYESIIYSLFLSMRLSRCFGRSTLFALGLAFLPVVFIPIIAFDKSQYLKPTRIATPAFGSGFVSVFKRELKSYFTTPIAYVFLVVFLAVSAHHAFAKRGFFDAREASLYPFFVDMPVLFLVIVPAVAMRLWAEERKGGSIEQLLTLPITVTQAVLGKFFAAWLFLGISLALTFPIVITVCFLGDPDPAPIATSYLACFLLAGGYLAIGCFFSAVSKNQVIAFVLSILACAVFAYSDDPSSQRFLSDILGGFLVRQIRFVAHVAQFSFRKHFESMLIGVLWFRDISYFVLLIIGWLAACTIILDDRKAK